MPLPEGVNTVTVTGKYPDLDGTPPTSGTVTFKVLGGVWLHDTGAKVAIPPVAEVKTIDSAGSFTAQLPANDDPSLVPNGFLYEITESIVYLVGTQSVVVGRTRTVPLPSIPATVDITELIEVDPVTPSVMSVRSINGEVPDGAGNVVLSALDVGALAAGTDLFLQAEADLLYKPLGYVAPVTSVNGQGGVVNLSAGDVGAVPVVAPVNLVDPGTGTIDTNAAQGNHFRVRLTGNRTLANPSGTGAALHGKKVVWEIVQDGTGGRTLALGDKFVLGDDMPSLVLSTTPGRRDYLGAVYLHTDVDGAALGEWHVLAFKKGN